MCKMVVYKTVQMRKTSLVNMSFIRVLFLLVYGLNLVAYEGVTANNINSISTQESLRTRPRQARLALQELNLIPGPNEEQRQNDKFLKNLPKVINANLIFIH